jgi:branched-chain amino acid aminotransferase
MIAGKMVSLHKFTKKYRMTSDKVAKVTPVAGSRIAELDTSNIRFGKLYADHMFSATFENGEWGNLQILPYQNLSLSPATTFFHYGQAIFEGIKAYRDQAGNVKIFRPEKNWERMNRSARRMAMPEIPYEIFISGMQQLLALDAAWVPGVPGSSLYIRPFMVATDEFIGVHPAENFLFLIITSPAGPYYNKPISIFVQDEYVRAFPGGIGYTKAAGNYGMSMYPTMQIKKMGYDQILWTDGIEHKYVQEIGTMNVFFVISGKLITPPVSEDTILEGVTRMSIITLANELGITVEERPIAIDEIISAHQSGSLTEAFGTGTAASIASIQKLTIHGTDIELGVPANWTVTNKLAKELSDIRYGIAPDRHSWMMPV